MSTPHEILLACGVSYLAGSIPWGLLLGILRGKDPRDSGSGNIGATNVARSGGLGLGLLTLVLDALKGALPVLFFVIRDPLLGAVAGLLAIVGHCFPVWLRFKGGKGVATLLGVAGALLWPWGLVLFVLAWAIVFGLSRHASLGSLVATWTLPFVAGAIAAGTPAVLSMAGAALIVTLRHRDNIQRLRAGTEARFGKPRKEGSS